jgi:rare lipoprotein A
MTQAMYSLRKCLRKCLRPVLLTTAVLAGLPVHAHPADAEDSPAAFAAPALPVAPHPTGPGEPGEDADRAPAVAPVQGRVSYYGRGFAGRRKASGERFDPRALTMAHRSLPFGARLRVTNLANRQSVVVRVNDRGPFIGGRVADLSHAAAVVLGMLHSGVARASLEILPASPAAPGRPG